MFRAHQRQLILHWSCPMVSPNLMESAGRPLVLAELPLPPRNLLQIPQILPLLTTVRIGQNIYYHHTYLLQVQVLPMDSGQQAPQSVHIVRTCECVLHIIHLHRHHYFSAGHRRHHHTADGCIHQEVAYPIHQGGIPTEHCARLSALLVAFIDTSYIPFWDWSIETWYPQGRIARWRPKALHAN